MPTTRTTTFRELDRRNSGGVEVTLLWNELDDSLVVAMSNAARGAHAEFRTEPSVAREAFNHPFPYATAHGLRCDDIFLEPGQGR
jgi:hypothetical protein